MRTVLLERRRGAPEGRTAQPGARSRPYPSASAAARVLGSRLVLQRRCSRANVCCRASQALHEQRCRRRTLDAPAVGAFA